MSVAPPADRLVAFEGRALGSALRLHVRLGAPGDEVAPGTAWDAVRAEFDAVDRALSRFRDDSELTALNRAAGSGRTLAVSWRLREAVAIMARAARMTEGRFDPTVLTDLERLGEHGAEVGHPGGGDRPVTPSPTGSLERPRIVAAPPLPLDTGGIGKGLALRWAADRALATLPADAGLLLEAGGDIVAAGRPPEDAWRVAIEDPVMAGTPDAGPVAVVLVEGGAVATSSVRVRHWLAPDGRAVHHLLDPRTREPARTGLLAVTVAGPDPAWAEVWTKALFLAGRGAIGAEARRRDLAAWWVTDEGRLGMSPAARGRSLWVAEARLG
ncbi:MAG TPA: FAD:protein FMN transferase [Candidatus Limnocylindrales bacterium]|nr:FAD:protein FMN transferase [Candidatus Limnocylindrales bacterium]